MKIFLFLAYGLICLTEGFKLYARFVQHEAVPEWLIYLFLSVAILIPGLFGFLIKNKGFAGRFFVGSGRVLICAALLLGCILSQQGLERDKAVIAEPTQSASHTLQSAQSKEEDARLAFRASNETQKPKVVNTTPLTFTECVSNGREYYSDRPFERVKQDVLARCAKSVVAFGPDRY